MQVTAASKNQRLETLVLQHYTNPNKDLTDEIINAATGLVYHYANKYTRVAFWQDLTQAGYEGVLKALKTYDPSREASFATYATYYIIGEMQRELHLEVSFDLPPGLNKLKTQISEVTDSLRQVLQREPNLSEIAEVINIKEEGIVEAMLAGTITLEEVDVSQIKSMYHESFKLPIEDQLLLKEAISKLSGLQQKIIYMNFFQGLTQSRIASESSSTSGSNPANEGDKKENSLEIITQIREIDIPKDTN